jgi:hypothetical protein
MGIHPNRIVSIQSRPRHVEFGVFFHKNPADVAGTLLDNHSRFTDMAQAKRERDIQMEQRSVEQKKAGIYYTVQVVPLTVSTKKPKLSK